MTEFTLTLKLGNAAMQTPEDVADALRRAAESVILATRVGVTNQGIRDENGNTVGSWTLDLPEPEPEPDCECSEDYGPCEQHADLLVSRELASRGADDLALTLINDLIECGAELPPNGREELAAIEADYETDRASGIGHFISDDTFERATDLAEQLEQDRHDLWIIHDDGYRILRPHADLPAGDVMTIERRAMPVNGNDWRPCEGWAKRAIKPDPMTRTGVCPDCGGIRPIELPREGNYVMDYHTVKVIGS